MRRRSLLALCSALMVGAVSFTVGGARAAPPPVLFTTIQVGSPDPVAPGGQVTWFLQALNEGTETLINVGWSHPVCGGATLADVLPSGAFSPASTCVLTAPASGEAEIIVQWTATVQSTGEVLTPVVRTTVQVQAPPTPTDTTTTSTTTTEPTTTTTTAATTTTTTTLLGAAETVTELSSSANPSVVGQPVTFTAAVTSPGGSLTISDGGVLLAIVALEDGRATFTTSSLSVGNHTITAAFSGTAAAAPSSATITQQVNQAASPAALPATR